MAKPNPRNRAAPMRLYQREQLERAALAKWGSRAKLEAERERRQQLREQRSIASYFKQPAPAAGEGGAARQASPTVELHSLGAAAPPPWLAGLPPLLAERVSLVSRQAGAAEPAGPAAAPAPPSALGPSAGGGGNAEPPAPRCVFYWMQTAVRAHENPALDVAGAGRPPLVQRCRHVPAPAALRPCLCAP